MIRFPFWVLYPHRVFDSGPSQGLDSAPVLDLVPQLQDWADEPGQPELFLDIVHVTPATHSRIATRLVEILRPLLENGKWSR